MPTLSVYRLHFHSGFHLGLRGVNPEESNVTIPSDTLFSALVDGWRRLGGNVDAWLKPFLTDSPNPPFLLTSAFPFAGDARFYPAPVNLHRLFSMHRKGKSLKRIRYISEQLFVKALTGNALDEWLPEEQNDLAGQATQQRAEPPGLFLQNGQLWLAREHELEKLPGWIRFNNTQKRALRALPLLALWEEGRVPRVTVDRINSASTIFHVGQVRFAPQCGLWFGISWHQPALHIDQTTTSYQESVASILAFLQDEGLGGVRSAGYGAFKFDGVAEELQLPAAQAGGPAWLLSRYHPRSHAELAGLTGSNAAYRLTSVAGWLRSPDSTAQRRKRIYLLEEGSVVEATEGVMGDMTKVTPDYDSQAGRLPHEVYRAGFGLAIGMAKERAHG